MELDNVLQVPGLSAMCVLLLLHTQGGSYSKAVIQDAIGAVFDVSPEMRVKECR